MGFEWTAAIRDALFGRSGNDQIQRLNEGCSAIDGKRFVHRFSEIAQKNITVRRKPGVKKILKYFQAKKMPLAIASGASRRLLSGDDPGNEGGD